MLSLYVCVCVSPINWMYHFLCSARDEKEVALCIKDLNSPSFHPSMISLWVTDSFERKDVERNLLAKLLVNLAKSHDGLLSHSHLVKGYKMHFTVYMNDRNHSLLLYSLLCFPLYIGLNRSSALWRMLLMMLQGRQSSLVTCLPNL